MKTKLFLLLTAVLLAGCTKQGERAERILPGEPVPDFQTWTVGGVNVSSVDLLGKPGLVVFFSTTCPDCKVQMPEVEAAYRTLGDEVVFLAIAREEDAQTVSRYWKDAGYTMPVAAPGKRDIYNLFDRGSGSGVPLIIFFDADGVVTGSSDDKNLLEAYQIVDWFLFDISLNKS